MRPKPIKFRQGMFAGRPLIGGVSSFKVRVNKCRTTDPSTIVSLGYPKVHLAREHRIEREKSIEEELSHHEHEFSTEEVVLLLYQLRGKRSKFLLSMKEKRKLRVILRTPRMYTLNCLLRLLIRVD
ncbi:hypothetical protein ACH5RR_025685 [Cinchona calisaya]|uniref:Uncharacterized protein n=1 Tax=Cinchona calisaya TaxID=153742 RepID=A0ABD2Z0C5_9GENT